MRAPIAERLLVELDTTDGQICDIRWASIVCSECCSDLEAIFIAECLVIRIERLLVVDPNFVVIVAEQNVELPCRE